MFGPGARILIYSHDTYGIGNVRRTLELSRAFSALRDDLSILVVTGSPWVDSFDKPNNVETVKLPELKRLGMGAYGARASGFEVGGLQAMRTEICRAAVSHFRPDVLLVDKGPFGVDGELEPALAELAAVNPDCVRILALRDILDEPSRVRPAWEYAGNFDAVAQHYQHVWVFGTPDFYDVGAEYVWPEKLTSRLDYLGFIGREETIAPSDEIRSRLGVGDGRMVLVTVGGGDDGELLMNTYCDALEQTEPIAPDTVHVLVPGPQCKDTTLARVSRVAANNDRVRCVHLTTEMMSVMAAADVVVCMAGYNTMCEVLQTRTRALVVPRTRPVREQWLRASRLAERDLIRMINPEGLSVETLNAELELMLGGWQPAPLDPSTFPMDAHHRAAAAVDALLPSRDRSDQTPALGARAS